MTRRVRRPERIFAALVTALTMAIFLGLYPVLGAGQEGGAAPNPNRVVPLHPVGAIPGQYIVVFDEGVTDPRGLAEALARRHGFTLRHSYAHALKGFAARMPAPVVQALAEDPDVAFVEPDLYARIGAQTIPTGIYRSAADLNAIANIDGNDDRIDVDIAIIDTGIDLDHPDLNVYRAVNCNSVAQCSSKRKAGDDDNGHGSHVAGTAAALDNGIGVVGVAPGARLWAVKVLNAIGSGSFSDVIRGIDYVKANAGEIEVANMSLGGQGSSGALELAIQNSVAAGVVYVVSAGNRLRDVYGSDGVFGTGDEMIPAAYAEAMTVSAMADFDGQPGGLADQIVTFSNCTHSGDDVFACFSNFSKSVAPGNPVTSSGAAIDVAGPGVKIYSTWRDGGYNTISGTSMAAPHVTGAVALEIAANGRASNASDVWAIRQALIDAAEGQGAWGPANTKDPDNDPEGLVSAAGGAPPDPNTAPSVSITSPTDSASYGSGAIIDFTGSASDAEDGSLTVALAWTSTIDGSIDSGGSFSRSLSDGFHTIMAEATDSGGKSGSASTTITVGDPPPAATTVSVDPLVYSTVGGKSGDKHLYVTVALLDDLGDPVGGATVTAVVTRDQGGSWDGTGTTADDGTAKFSVKNAPSGDYTTDVTVSAPGLIWDGINPDPGYTK